MVQPGHLRAVVVPHLQRRGLGVLHRATHDERSEPPRSGTLRCGRFSRENVDLKRKRLNFRRATRAKLIFLPRELATIRSWSPRMTVIRRHARFPTRPTSRKRRACAAEESPRTTRKSRVGEVMHSFLCVHYKWTRFVSSTRRWPSFPRSSQGFQHHSSCAASTSPLAWTEAC